MTSEVCAANGSSTAVEQSGTSIMSESLIAFHPAIDDPSNITPSLRKSSLIVRTCCARCCHLPRGSVKRKSTYLTSCSLIISMTFAVSDIPFTRSDEGEIGSDVVVEEELVGVWAQPHLVDFAGALVAQMGVDDIRGEHVAFQQKSVVGFERIERFLERARGRGHLGELLGRQVVEVFVDRLARM